MDPAPYVAFVTEEAVFSTDLQYDVRAENTQWIIAERPNWNIDESAEPLVQIAGEIGMTLVDRQIIEHAVNRANLHGGLGPTPH